MVTFRRNRNFHYDFGDGFLCVCMFENLYNCIFCAQLIVCQLYFNKAVLKSKKKKEKNLRGF